MNKNKIRAVIVAISIIVLLAGCATSTSRIDTPLRISEYNDVVSKYMTRPTFVRLEKYNGNDDRLVVSFDQYGTKTTSMTFMKEYVDSYISNIEKYLKWESLASSRHDQLNKVIGEGKLWAGVSLQFSIYSGNARNHYLSINVCSLGLCGQEEVPPMLNKGNALILKNLLLKFKRDSLHETNEAVYK